MFVRVLVIDEASRAGHVATGLRLEGLGVESAQSADGALALLDRESFDVALVDLMMPGTNAIQLARMIRDRHPHTRVVLTSRYHVSERQLFKADCGGVGFVPRPSEPYRLAQLLRAQCGCGASAASSLGGAIA